MIVTYPNYLDQTQIIGLGGIIEWHGIHVEVVTPYPLNISISKSLEYGIAISKSHEYTITLSKSHEYSITMSKSGGGS